MKTEAPIHTLDRSDEQRRRWWNAPPTVLAHIVLVVPIAMYLWSQSVPGIDIVLWFFAVAATGLCGLLWLLWFANWVWKRTPRSPAWRWAIAPAMVVAAVLLGVADVPVKMRFERDRGAFDAITEDLDPAGSFDQWAELEVPERIGSFEILGGSRVGRGVILYEGTGELMDDAGFAYLPDGPDDRLANGGFESPSFRSLGGDWYAWTASW